MPTLGAQTPQGFDVQLLKECHEKGVFKVGKSPMMLYLKSGLSVRIVNEGGETNLKVTTPVDLRSQNLSPPAFKDLKRSNIFPGYPK